MSLRTIYHSQFESDADSAKAWYEGQLPGLGIRFEKQLEFCVRQVEQRPMSFLLARGSLRRAFLADFPYAVVFEVAGDLLIIAGVFHTARDRSIWDSRM